MIVVISLFSVSIFPFDSLSVSLFNFLREIKRLYDTRVIMLTANDLEMDIVAGLEAGADDYITKPFSLAVLRARINTQLRNLNKETDNESNGKIDTEKNFVTKYFVWHFLVNRMWCKHNTRNNNA